MKESIAMSMKLFKLPVLSFRVEDNKYINLLIDSGSDANHIDRRIKTIFPDLVETKTENFVMYAGGNQDLICSVHMTFSDDEKQYEADFNYINGDPFDFMEKDTGVRIHGILGTCFMVAHNWTIDFANLLITDEITAKQTIPTDTQR